DDGWDILCKYNDRCEPPWSDSELIHKMEDALRQPSSNGKSRGWRRSGGAVPGEGEYNPVEGKYILSPSRTLPIGQCFIDMYFCEGGRILLRYYGGMFLQWKDNTYREIDESEIKYVILRFLTESACTIHLTEEDNIRYRDFPANDRIVKDILAELMGWVPVPREPRQNSWIGEEESPCDPNDLIFGPTRIYNWRTESFLDPDPRWFNHSTLSVDVDPVAEKPKRFFRFLKEILGQDDASKWLLLEYFGLLLTANTSFQKLLLIVGPKRSGKGTLERLLVHLLGRENIASPQTSSLAERFGLQSLIGKTLAAISDARFSGRDIQKAIEVILNITGEDYITIDRKYRDPVTVRLGTRLMILSNESPRLPDASGAIVSRFLVLKLTRSFFGHEDRGLDDALAEELPGILKWFLKGLRRLMMRGRFIQPASGEEVIGEMMCLGSPIQTFVEERCQLNLEERCTTTALYNAWSEWCRDNNMSPSSQALFGRSLQAAFPKIRRRDGGRFHDGKKMYFYEGIRLYRDECEM
uniref:DNA primase family protein n=1 Tax=Parapedobacter pyrenivorans TaxID=1305674 RepID=UPI003341ACF6